MWGIPCSKSSGRAAGAPPYTRTMSTLELIAAWGLVAGGALLLLSTLRGDHARGPRIKQGGIAVAVMAVGALVLLNG